MKNYFIKNYLFFLAKFHAKMDIGAVKQKQGRIEETENKH